MYRINKLILEQLKDGEEHQASDISKRTNKQLSGLFYALSNLMNEKEIIKTEYGKYKITEIGLKALELEEMKNEKI
jgi:predicted transcriptional regulator